MKRFYWPFVLVMVAIATLVSCTKEQSPFETAAGTRSVVPSTHATGGVTAALIAGRTIEVGSVTCRLEDNVLYVEYATRDGWMLSETHLVVAGSAEGIPVTRSGNPVPGRFPLKAQHDPCVSAFGYTVDMDAQGLAGAPMLYIAAHAVVKWFDGEVPAREEGAWADGDRIRSLANENKKELKGNWGMYFTVNVAQLRGLLLWNKLGTPGEVVNSVVGPNGIIRGGIDYAPCVYGNGFKPLPRTGDHNIPDNLIDYLGVGLGPQGCIEFWYLPTWSGWEVGHCVELLMYGLPTNYGQTPKVAIQVTYNDWQDLLLFGTTNVVNGVYDGANGVGIGVRPSTIPDWSTTQPFHIALVWDGAAPTLLDRARVYVNGTRVGTTSVAGNPTFIWPQEYFLRVGSRVHAGDWDRHNWEGVDGIIDNIKVWNYAKSDFSDRFNE